MSKRIKTICCILFAAALLSGCSEIEEQVLPLIRRFDLLQTLIWDLTEIEKDPDYMTYTDMKENNELDREGLYDTKDLIPEPSDEPVPQVRVTFPENNYLNISYYRDEAMTQPIDPGACRMDPGESIYASGVFVNDKANRYYRFDKLDVLSYDNSGKNVKTLASVQDLPGLVFHIPEDFSGTELSVIPLGAYGNRSITLRANLLQPNGESLTLSGGKWTINNEQVSPGTHELPANKSYQIIFDYTDYREDYYLEEAVPASVNDALHCRIIFDEINSDDDVTDFHVLMHPFLNLLIDNEIFTMDPAELNQDVVFARFSGQNLIQSIAVNGEPMEVQDERNALTRGQIKVGDTITIRVGKPCKVISPNLHPEPGTPTSSGYEYTIRVPELASGAFKLLVCLRNTLESGTFRSRAVEHADFTVTDSHGLILEDGDELPAEREQLTYTLIPEEGWYAVGEDTEVLPYAMMDTFLTEHPLKLLRTVNVDNTEGECVFRLDDEAVTGVLSLEEEQQLTVEFTNSPKETGGFWENLFGHPLSIIERAEIDIRELPDGAILRCEDYRPYAK